MSELPAAEHEALYQSSLLSEERTTLNLTCEIPLADEACDKVLSVTIVADNGTMADAYSTALYVMGREAAQDFWRQNGGFDMVLITKDGQVLYTPGLADRLTEVEGSGYAYACIEP